MTEYIKECFSQKYQRTYNRLELARHAIGDIEESRRPNCTQQENIDFMRKKLKTVRHYSDLLSEFIVMSELMRDVK